ncbi:hypothetical protein CASFOL_024345 [Castilleja foliolosa]|uniref:Uncharacterized protein n=1 Tax=Castilleja foliolosa TaxID=1961234 RepID=A0ABD3CR45_9LAMI
MEAVRSTGTKYDCLLFDMDDTLYPLSLGINMACRKNIEEYMLHHLNIEESEIPRMCLDLYKEYGTTMTGLKVLGYEFDNDEYQAYVHGRLPYELLKPDPVLRNLLLSMPQQKIIFTNADEVHVAKVLTMEAAIRFANIFFDDSVRNITNGKAAGLHTVIVGQSTLVTGADHALNSIHNIREALPEIWNEEGEHLGQTIQTSAVETVVLA